MACLNFNVEVIAVSAIAGALGHAAFVFDIKAIQHVGWAEFLLNERSVGVAVKF